MSERICKIEGCDGSHKARGWCSKHYKRWRRYGDPTHTIYCSNDDVCSVEDCREDAHARGWCRKHYDRWRAHGDPNHIKTEGHGMNGTLIYRVWDNMKQRCSNLNHIRYDRYGGRGISVCKKWRDDFAAFYEDMGDKPTPDHQIDRVDNDGDYEPANCRWVTPAENTQNQSTTKLTKEKVRRVRERYAGGNSTQADIAKEFGVHRTTIGCIVRGKLWQNVGGPIKNEDY